MKIKIEIDTYDDGDFDIRIADIGIDYRDGDLEMADGYDVNYLKSWKHLRFLTRGHHLMKQAWK